MLQKKQVWTCGENIWSDWPGIMPSVPRTGCVDTKVEVHTHVTKLCLKGITVYVCYSEAMHMYAQVSKTEVYL